MEKKNIHILLVTGHDADRQRIVSFIQDRQLATSIELAASAEEARGALEKGHFDLLLWDSNQGSPVEPGILAHAGELAVVLLIASGNEITIAENGDAGFVDYLVKDPEHHYLELLPLVINKALACRDTEKALKESEEKFHLLSEQSALGIVILNDNRFVFVNRAVAEILDYSIEEMEKWKADECFSKMIHPDDVSLFREGINSESLDSKGAAVNFSWRAITKSGRTSWIESYARPVVFNSQSAVLVTLIDMTERKHAEVNLHEKQRTLSTLMGNLPGMAYRRLDDNDWTMEFVSEGSAGLTGYVPSALIKNRIVSYNDLIHPDDQEPVWEQVQAALELRQPYLLEYRIRTASAEDKWVWEKGVGIFDEDGELVALEGFVIDITERKKAEEELRKHRDHLEEMVAERTVELEKTNRELEQEIHERKQAEEKIQFEMSQRLQAEEQLKVLVGDLDRANKELQDFAYIISQDLKVPLRGINSLASRLLEEYSEPLDKDGRQYLSRLLSRTRRMQNLIDGILQYSRIGRFQTQAQVLDSGNLIRKIIEGLSIPDNIRVRVNGTLPTVVYDKILFDRVFRNLIGNAVKHMGKPEGEVIISCRENDRDDVWEFCVKDNGVGIAEKDFDRIFRIFQTLEPQDEMESTGIGLALVKKIAERNRGKVWVESVLGIGSSFFFTVPRKSEVVKAASFYTVLIIDDNLEFIKVARAMLELEGHKVLIAASRSEAEEILVKDDGEIKVVLMDIHIPGEDPLDRYLALRKLAADIKIIACTGVDVPETLRDLKKAGLNGILTKPFKISELYNIINESS